MNSIGSKPYQSIELMATNNSIVSSTNVEFEIIHAVRGRVRLRLKGDYAREILPHISQQLRQQAGIFRVQIKQANNSLVIGFDPDIISLNELINSLEAVGFSHVSAEGAKKLTEKSLGITSERLLSIVPLIVGIGLTRSLQLSGWKSILTYILAAGLTREIIDQVTGKSDASEQVTLPPAKKASTTEVAAEIALLLAVIETDYQIIHQIPGRIRLRVPLISQDFDYAQKLKYQLEQDSRIIQVRCKNNTGSIVILYNSDAFYNSHQDKLTLDDSNGQGANQITPASENSTTPETKTVTESDFDDEPPSGDASSSESISLTSEIEAESTTSIVNEESAPNTKEEFI